MYSYGSGDVGVSWDASVMSGVGMLSVLWMGVCLSGDAGVCVGSGFVFVLSVSGVCWYCVQMGGGCGVQGVLCAWAMCVAGLK